jgi:hypothetical protein
MRRANVVFPVPTSPMTTASPFIVFTGYGSIGHAVDT